jgi:DNA repair exonuclease SbcCD ATPase subunit
MNQNQESSADQNKDPTPVVEGEFIEAEPLPKAEKVKRESSADMAWRSRGLMFSVMLVSAVGLALGMASWLTLKSLQKQAPIMTLVPESTHSVELDALIEKIAYQQGQIQVLSQESRVQQSLLQAFEEQLKTLDERLNEVQLHLADIRTQEPSVTEPSLAPEPPLIEPPISSVELDEKEWVSQHELSVLAQDVMGLKQTLQTQMQTYQQWMDQWQQSQAQPVWQAEYDRLREQLELLTQQLEQLAQEQASWQTKFQLKPIVEDVTPQMDGIWSRFNHLFSIKKHTEAETGE